MDQQSEETSHTWMNSLGCKNIKNKTDNHNNAGPNYARTPIKSSFCRLRHKIVIIN